MLLVVKLYMNISLDCLNAKNNDTVISRNEICSTLCGNKHSLNMVFFLYTPLCVNIVSTILAIIVIKSSYKYYKRKPKHNKSSQCNEIHISQVVLHPFENEISLAIAEEM